MTDEEGSRQPPCLCEDLSDALQRVWEVLRARRREVEEYEADSPPSTWSNAVAVTCDRIEYAIGMTLRPEERSEEPSLLTVEDIPEVDPH